MSGKQKRRYSDSDAEAKNPFLTSEPKQQTAPANPFTSQSPENNPFNTSPRILRPVGKSQRSRLSLTTQRISQPDDCKLRALGFDPRDVALGQKIKKEVDCSVRVFWQKGWATLTFESAQKASEALERGLRVEGHPNLSLSPYQRGDKKKNVFDRLDKPPQHNPPTEPGIFSIEPERPGSTNDVFERLDDPSPAPYEPLPVPHTVFSTSQPDPRQGRAPDREEQLFKLEQRDQQLRETARPGPETIRGTCEDMCPEKERFWREERHCLNSYELLPGPGYAVDHTAAVKEFSRNAADKSQPLPHELRTEGALERTLLYLCHRVLPARPYSRDWYAYLSNRLEAMRQDVTIQHLCSLRSARIMEACARFHALCAHILIEVGLESADLEMNDMKLRSILTPLLQMYRDLRLTGVRIPDEPVFVSLSLVLAIQTGLIAYDLLLLSDAVINSPPVQFVLQVWQAVHCDDYARFFRLLRHADFLTGSLLNRFVPDLRLKALQQMSASASKMGDTMDTDHLVRLLCFDDVTQCATICAQAGLQCDAGGVHLTGTKHMDAPPGLRGLTLSLIRYKNSCELGEAVYGDVLPAFLPRPPSFSSHSIPPTQEPSWDSVIESIADVELGGCMDNVLLTELENLVEEVVGKWQRDQQLSKLSEQLSAELTSNVIGEIMSEIMRCEVAREVAERRRRQERAEFIARTQVHVLEELLCQELSEVVKLELASEREHRTIVQSAVSAVSMDTYEKVAREVVEEVLCVEAEVGISEAKRRRKERLESARLEVLKRKLMAHWGVWRDAFVLREKRRESVRQFPRLPPDRVDRDLWSLGPTPVLQQLVSAGQKERVSSWLEEKLEQAQRDRKELATPICIPQLLGKAFISSRFPEGGSSCAVDWLLLVLIAAEGAASDWLLEVLGGEGAGQVRTLSDRSALEEGRHLRVRVRAVQGVCSPRDLKGSSAVLLLTEGTRQSDVNEKLDLLKGVKRTPPLPLFILHTLQPPKQLITPPACIGVVQTRPLPPVPSLSGRGQLEGALLWLAEHSSPQPRLVSRSLLDFVGDRMYKLFSGPVAAHSAERERLGIHGPSLLSVSSLYESALTCVREELCGRFVQELNWPIAGEEGMWRWNEDVRLEEIRTGLDRLKLVGGFTESFEEFLSGYQDMCPILVSECHSMLTRHLNRLKRMGLPLCPPWADILETMMHSGMQREEFDTYVCHERDRKIQIRLPSDWMRSLDETRERSVSIAPALRRKINQSQKKVQESRKRRSDPLTPRGDTSPQERASKTARLEVEKSLVRLEEMVREEVSQSEGSTENMRSLIKSYDDVTTHVSWEEQLQWVEDEVRKITESGLV